MTWSGLVFLFLCSVTQPNVHGKSMKSSLNAWIVIESIEMSEELYMILQTNNETLKRIDLTLTESPMFYRQQLSPLSVGCFFRGFVVRVNEKVTEHSDDAARIKYCSGYLSGLLMIGGTIWNIHTEPDHSWILFSNEQLIEEVATCVVHDSEFQNVPRNGSSQSKRQRRDAQERYVEISLFHDSAYFVNHDSDVQEINDRAIDIIHQADIFYSNISGLNLNLVLIDVVIWEDESSEPFEIVTSAGDLMTEFLKWRYANLDDLLPHDNGILISGIELDGTTVGLAPLGTLCQGTLSGSLVEDHNRNSGVLAGTVAHELGHNFKLEHNPTSGECACGQGQKCVMNSFTSGQPDGFTECQKEILRNKIDQGFGVCLHNRPTLTFGDPFCGDKFVNQDWEQCDCGSEAVCEDPCCDANTCKLVSEAECSAVDLCCTDTCKLRTEGSTCRSVGSLCDLPEYCDGKSSQCPSDVYIQNGEACSRGDNLKSHCYYGQCTTVYDQCIEIFEPDDRIELETDERCWSLNKLGDDHGNCADGVACSPADTKCGKLQCGTGHNSGLESSVGSAVYYSTYTEGLGCFSIDEYKPIADGIDDFAYVQDGTWCAPESICVDRHCLNISDIPGLQICPHRCHGNGVCNSENHCHCDVGWAPPYCNVPGNGGSVDSGPASETPDTSSATRAVLIFFLVIIPVIIVISVVVFIFRRPIKLYFHEVYEKHFSTFPVDAGRQKGPTNASGLSGTQKYTPGKQLSHTIGCETSNGAPKPAPRTRKPQASDFAITFDSVLIKERAANDEMLAAPYDSSGQHMRGLPGLSPGLNYIQSSKPGTLPDPPQSSSLKQFANMR